MHRKMPLVSFYHKFLAACKCISLQKDPEKFPEAHYFLFSPVLPPPTLIKFSYVGPLKNFLIPSYYKVTTYPQIYLSQKKDQNKL